MKYGLPLLLTALAVLVPMPDSADAAEKVSKRPNILYIMSDDHASHAMSCYGSVINKTPNLDRIANEGIRFTNSFCTNSICGPCRAVVLTGKYSHLNGFIRNGNTFDGEQQTVAKLLRRAGYETAMVGKWHLKSDPTGFDFWHVLVGQGPYYNPPMKTPQGVVEHEGYTTDVITDMALDYLKNRDREKPFFLMYHHKAPHRNWQPGPKYLTLYDDVSLPEPDNLFDDWSDRGTAAHEQKMTVANDLNSRDLKLEPPPGLTEEQLTTWNAAYDPKNKAFQEAKLAGDDLVRWKYQRYIKDYCRSIASVDENVGRVLDYLDESGLTDNTIVIYTSDQGFYLGDHGWFDKRFMYEESLRMPLVVRWPGHVKPGSVSDEIVLNLDFAETFLDAAGESIPDDMQGRSIRPILEGKTPHDWRPSTYYRYYEFPGGHSVQKHYGVRTQRHKLIFFHELEEWELFDLEKDPREMKSVYHDPAYAAVVKELKIELARLREHYKDDDTVRGTPSVQTRNPNKVKLELALHYDFSDLKGGRVSDASGRGHDGRMAAAESVEGRRGKALKLYGRAAVKIAKMPDSLSPDFRPLVVGGWCKPASADGVLVAMGGGSHGFSLYLEDGVPRFVVNASNSQASVKGSGKVKIDQWVHLAGAIDAKGRLWLFVDGRPVADAKGSLIPQKPSDGFSVGSDTGSPVAQYKGSAGYSGLLEDVRLYWGLLGKDELRKWAE